MVCLEIFEWDCLIGCAGALLDICRLVPGNNGRVGDIRGLLWPSAAAPDHLPLQALLHIPVARDRQASGSPAQAACAAFYLRGTHS